MHFDNIKSGMNLTFSVELNKITLDTVLDMTEKEAFEAFKKIRWGLTDGNPICPLCKSIAVYTYLTRPIFKCSECKKQFSATTNTIFHSKKTSFYNIMLAIVIFVRSKNTLRPITISSRLELQYKTAFVLVEKIKEAFKEETVHRTSEFKGYWQRNNLNYYI